MEFPVEIPNSKIFDGLEILLRYELSVYFTIYSLLMTLFS